MTQNAHVPARQPVSDILREAARLGLELQPGTLPPSAGFLYAAIGETLDPLQRVEGPLGYRNALDTTVPLCAERGAEHAGERLVPSTVHRVEHLIARCSALYEAPGSYVAGAFRRLGTACGDGIPASPPNDRANPVRDEHIRRVYGDRTDYSALAHGADYPALAGRRDLAPGASAKSSIPAEPQAVTELPPNSEKAITLPVLNVHATPAGC